MEKLILHLIGCASGVAGADEHSGDGPLVIQHSPYLSVLAKDGIRVKWDAMVRGAMTNDMRIDESVHATCVALAEKTAQMVRENNVFSVVGGDHSCAIGTWSGVQSALQDKGDIGLIWFDAHMDSHTPETSESGRIHGMPAACLLGYGFPTLTNILNNHPKLKPENICFIGIRSYESGEAEFLKKLNVRIFFMEEVKERGFKVVMEEAVSHVTKHTIGYGISIDLDGLDPEDAPGVDVPERDGVRAVDMLPVIAAVASDPRLIATEIVEFDPLRDIDHKTEKLAIELLHVIAKGKMKS
jgi:arginase